MSNRTKGIVGAVVGGLFLLFSMLVTGFDAWEFEGPSMAPTFLSSERVLSTSVDASELHRGDVVVVQSPADGVNIIKRIVGMPGESISIDTARLRIDGKLVPATDLGACDASWAHDPRCREMRWKAGARSWRVAFSHIPMTTPEVTVPANSFYLLGDHLGHEQRQPQSGPWPRTRREHPGSSRLPILVLGSRRAAQRAHVPSRRMTRPRRARRARCRGARARHGHTGIDSPKYGSTPKSVHASCSFQIELSSS